MDNSYFEQQRQECHTKRAQRALASYSASRQSYDEDLFRLGRLRRYRIIYLSASSQTMRDLAQVGLNVQLPSSKPTDLIR
jgi:hypothetical protein